MASGSSQTPPSYESGEGIATLRRLLNELHRPRACLHSELCFETYEVQSLGPAWISRVPSVVESNMPRENWFTPNPYSARSGISSSKWSSYRRGFLLMNDPTWAQWVDEPSFKQKWMSNGIYELIMLSKTSVISKPELLTSALLFWNTGTNTFDFRMGPMSPTILDMAQVFGLRPSGMIVDVPQDWVPSSTTGSSSSSTPFLHLNYNSATFKNYGTSFKGFIPFVKENFGAGSPRADKDQEHMYFLLYWLNKHIFPNKSNGVRVEWIPLVEVLHNFDDVATCPFLLSHLYPDDTNLAAMSLQDSIRLRMGCVSLEEISLLSLKSYPGSGELAKWKEMIQEKNRSLLIALVDIESEAIESENDSADAVVLHGAAAEAERREAGEGTDVSESIGDSGAEETPKAITKASKRKKATMTKTSNPDPAPLPATTRPILTRKSKRARITIPPKSAVPSAPVPEAGRKKQQSSRPQASKRPILASKEEPLRAAMLKKAEALRNTAL
ncbi:unnamed protein product [Malus baccata var. baccata]